MQGITTSQCSHVVARGILLIKDNLSNPSNFGDIDFPCIRIHIQVMTNKVTISTYYSCHVSFCNRSGMPPYGPRQSAGEEPAASAWATSVSWRRARCLHTGHVSFIERSQMPPHGPRQLLGEKPDASTRPRPPRRPPGRRPPPPPIPLHHRPKGCRSGTCSYPLPSHLQPGELKTGRNVASLWTPTATLMARYPI